MVLPVISAGAVFQIGIAEGKFQGVISETTPSGACGGTVLHRIALDGVATGTIQEMPEILLGPGYRTDVLVQAPTCPEQADECVSVLVGPLVPNQSECTGLSLQFP